MPSTEPADRLFSMSAGGACAVKTETKFSTGMGLACLLYTSQVVQGFQKRGAVILMDADKGHLLLDLSNMRAVSYTHL